MEGEKPSATRKKSGVVKRSPVQAIPETGLDPAGAFTSADGRVFDRSVRNPPDGPIRRVFRSAYRGHSIDFEQKKPGGEPIGPGKGRTCIMVSTQEPTENVRGKTCGSSGPCTGQCRGRQPGTESPPPLTAPADRRAFLGTALKAGLILGLPATGLLGHRASAAERPPVPTGLVPMRSPAHHGRFGDSRNASPTTFSPPTAAAESDDPANTAAPPSIAIIALNRMAFGPRNGDVAAFNALGSTDEERLAAYVEQQLDPGSIDDSAMEARLEDAGYTTLKKSHAQLWADHYGKEYSIRQRPFWESERAAFSRAVFSKRQLSEVLADFWHNHFNIYADNSQIAPGWVSYDRDVIRGHMLGNFRQMLQAVGSHPAMLYYLDNFKSTNAGPNENYARELFELHGLGAAHYYGVVRQADVPKDGSGRPLGYVDDDVYEATRAFTGWTIDFDNGTLLYRADRHDRFQKTVLGQMMPADQAPLRDGEVVYDLIASHPGAARHIARKLCRRLIADNPPEDVVAEAAAVFSANIEAPDQLERVVRTILLSQAFRNTWGQKTKRPFETLCSALRACGLDHTLRMDDRFSNDLTYYARITGQPVFRWQTPDGFPDTREQWLSSSSIIMSWRALNRFSESRHDSNVLVLDVLGETPATARSANQLADYWIERILGRSIAAAGRDEIVTFMGAGTNPDLALKIDPDSGTHERLRAMVALITMSPEFLRR